MEFSDSFPNSRDKLISVKGDVESVEQETELNMHALIQMDR